MVLVGPGKMKPLRVIVYQKIGTPPKNSHLKDEWTSVAGLTRTLDRLQRRHIHTVSPRQLLTQPPAPPSVLLLFLGGYRTFYTTVYPLLKERGLSACVCLPADCIGTYNRWQDPYKEPWQDLLTEEEIKELAQDPLISLGAMPLKAQDITLLPPKEASFSLQESAFRLAKIQSPLLLACHPAAKRLAPAVELWPDFQGITWGRKNCYRAGAVFPVKGIKGNSRWIGLLLWMLRFCKK